MERNINLERNIIKVDLNWGTKAILFKRHVITFKTIPKEIL